MKKIYTCIDIGTDTIRILVSEYYGKKFKYDFSDKSGTRWYEN